MSTAAEMQLRMVEANRRIAPLMLEISEAFAGVVNDRIVRAAGRPVCARRARKLRRRGELVVFSHKTPTGKATYRWIKKLNIVGLA